MPIKTEYITISSKCAQNAIGIGLCKTLLKKHPTAIAAIKGGWFVKTHSGTAAKMRYVKTIAKALKVKVVIAGA